VLVERDHAYASLAPLLPESASPCSPHDFATFSGLRAGVAVISRRGEHLIDG
jgi:hypothetical protein